MSGYAPPFTQQVEFRALRACTRSRFTETTRLFLPLQQGGSINVETTVVTPPTGWTADPVTITTGQETYIARVSVNPATQTGDITPTWSNVFQGGGSAASLITDADISDTPADESTVVAPSRHQLQRSLMTWGQQPTPIPELGAAMSLF